MTTTFLLSLWESFPSFKAQDSLHILREALPDCLSGHKVEIMEENRGKKKCTKDEEVAWEPDIRDPLMRPIFLSTFSQWG